MDNSKFCTAIDVDSGGVSRRTYVMKNVVTVGQLWRFDKERGLDAESSELSYLNSPTLFTFPVSKWASRMACDVSPAHCEKYAAWIGGRLLTYAEWIACFRIEDIEVDEETYMQAARKFLKAGGNGGLRYFGREIVTGDSADYRMVDGPIGYRCADEDVSQHFSWPLGLNEQYLLAGFRVCFDSAAQMELALPKLDAKTEKLPARA